MYLQRFTQQSETQKKRLLLQRMVFVHGFFLVGGLLIVSRLLELQVIKRTAYAEAAQEQHYGGVTLPAQRGEIRGLNSKTNETAILATNTTLDLVYVDPVSTPEPTLVAETLADVLLTPQVHDLCSHGSEECPRELISFVDSPYLPAFDPLATLKKISSGPLFEPLPFNLGSEDPMPVSVDLTEARRLFARDIERRVSEKRVVFAPIKYGATKPEMKAVDDLRIPGITVNQDSGLIWANPEELDQSRLSSILKQVSTALQDDPERLRSILKSRPLRYVAIMRKLTPELSLQIKQRKLDSMKATTAKRVETQSPAEAERIEDPMAGIALISEHWRYYPDPTIASHVIGFLNVNQEAQYGVERTYDAQLRGREGLISTVKVPLGGQILTGDQTIVDPKDGDTLVLTIDPFIQKEAERIMQAGLERYNAESAQMLVMDPMTGRMLAMANAPLFDRGEYAGVYEKEPLQLSDEKEREIVVEVYEPTTNVRIVRDYIRNVFTASGRVTLPAEIQAELTDLESRHDLHGLARYYLYVGEHFRHELFPTALSGTWLKFKNNIGVGAYLNRNIQEIYEPGSVMKPITMAIAIDQGEVTPSDEYLDREPVKLQDGREIYNNDRAFYGLVNMTNCLEFSINTCMTHISGKLGAKLFSRMIERFGFGRITGIELEDELPGEVHPWREWSDALLATASFGQGVSATPLQMIVASAALANGGKLMKPTIVDRVVHPDGSVDYTDVTVVDQVITPHTVETLTAMLVSSAEKGFAKVGRPEGYVVAGKTGTSQIAGPGGRYETGTGSTIASFMGYDVSPNSRFIILIKLDRPKGSIHGATAAAPLFKEMSAFLFKYYGVPPNRK
jgi:cell division protein FtsI/penicillin-binding protein 2